VESLQGERERDEGRVGDSERAGDDEREAYDAMRERKDMGDVGGDLGLRYIVVKAAVKSVEGTGIDMQGVRGFAFGGEASDAA
jgi:hypothetical protein